MSYTIPKTLKEKIEKNEVIPFVGAGISTGIRDNEGNRIFLDWNDLLLSAVSMLENDGMQDEADDIRTSMKVAKTAQKYLDIADRIEEYLSSRWQDFLKDNFLKDYDMVNEKTLEIPKEIWKLSNLVITTNYDNVLTWSANTKDLVSWGKKSISGQVESLKKFPRKKTLWHLHGHIDNLDDIVLTSKSYEEMYKEDSGAIEVLKSHMATKSFIFLGFSLDDIYLKEQLKKIKNLFGNNLSRHYILIKEGNKSDLSELGDIKPLFIKNYEEDYLRVLKELTNTKEEQIPVVDEKTVQINNEEDFIFNVPFKSKKDGAIGIEGKLLEVHEVLTDSKKTNIDQLSSFQGMGGLGKTQLAVEYAHIYKETYSGVLWFTVDQDMDEQLLDLGYKYAWVHKDIENKIKLEIIKKKIFALTNILFVFDNVDKKDEIKEFYEALTENKILITSRNAIQGFKSIPLDTLNEENSLKLLASESSRAITAYELEYAVKIFEELGGLPLALEMAGSYVEYLELDWQEYYELYKEKGIPFLEESEINSSTRHAVNISKTLSVSETLLEKNPLLEKIIYLLTWGANEAIDKNLMATLLEEKKINLTQPIKIGLKLKFLKESEDGFTLHRLVKDIYKIKKPLEVTVATKIAQNLSDYMKEIKDDFLKLRELDKASFQAKSWEEKVDDKYLKASLINYAVYPEYHRGKYKIALESINEVFVLFDDSQSSEIYAELLNNKGFLTESLGDSKEAKPYFEEALKMREALYPNTNHPDIANSLNNMGSVLESLGDSKEAKLYYEKALKMNESLYPNTNHPNIASSLNNMGFFLNSLGDSKEAKLYYEKALKMNESLYPNTNHPDIASSLNNMGAVLKSLGDSKEAKLYYEKALKMRELLYPNTNHPDIAGSLNNMGTVLQSLGDSKEAKPYYEKAYKMSNSIFGKKHKKTVLYMLNYIYILSLNPMTKSKAITILKEFKNELKGKNKELYTEVITRLKQMNPKGR